MFSLQNRGISIVYFMPTNTNVVFPHVSVKRIGLAAVFNNRSLHESLDYTVQVAVSLLRGRQCGLQNEVLLEHRAIQERGSYSLASLFGNASTDAHALQREYHDWTG